MIRTTGVRTLCLFIFLLRYSAFPHATSSLEEPDLYPDVHELLRLADSSSIGISQLDDHSDPGEYLGRLYARAGYLKDSARAYKRTKFVPFDLIKALALYGNLHAAEEEISSIVEPEKKVNAQLNVSDVLWRMGDSQNAERLLSAARISVGRVVDPAQRSELYKSISTSAEYLKSDPPGKLSAKPTPPSHPPPPINSPLAFQSLPRDLHLRIQPRRGTSLRRNRSYSPDFTRWWRPKITTV